MIQEIENLIPLVIFAFALSMISERLANILKLYLPAFFRFIVQLLGWSEPCLKPDNKYRFVFYHLDTKQTESTYQVLRDRIIQFFSLASGILVATIFEDQLVAELKGVPFWTVIGSGLLFSLGSKFWHDILDLLLITKNTRRRLSEMNTEDFSSAEEVKSYLLSTDDELIERAIRENISLFTPKISGFKFGKVNYDVVNGVAQKHAAIYLEGDPPEDLPKYIYASGSRHPIPVKAIPNLGPITSQALSPGDLLDVDVSNNVTSTGTLTCKVKVNSNATGGEASHYLLTCSHVLTKRKIKKIAPNQMIRINNEYMSIYKFLFKNNHDYALVHPSDPSDFSNDLLEDKDLLPERDVEKRDENNLLLRGMVMRENTKTEIIGVIRKYKPDTTLNVEYSDSRTLSFDNLIAISGPNAELPITSPGDSGAIFYDFEGRAIGMVIGADKKFTYLISMIDITNNLDCEIVQS